MGSSHTIYWSNQFSVFVYAWTIFVILKYPISHRMRCLRSSLKRLAITPTLPSHSQQCRVFCSTLFAVHSLILLHIYFVDNMPVNFLERSFATKTWMLKICHKDQTKQSAKLHMNNASIFFNGGPPKEDIFLTTIYGLYFSLDFSDYLITNTSMLIV